MTKKIENPALVEAFRAASHAALDFSRSAWGCARQGEAIKLREAAWLAILHKGGKGDFDATRKLRYHQPQVYR